MGNMRQVPYSGPTNIKRHRIKFRRQDDLAPGICARLYWRSGGTTLETNAAKQPDMPAPTHQIIDHVTFHESVILYSEGAQQNIWTYEE
jgi:hypothetical protein